MKKGEKFLRAIQTTSDEARGLFKIDTPEKKLLLAILNRWFADLLAVLIHGSMCAGLVRPRKNINAGSKSHKKIQKFFEFLLNKSPEEWRIMWILENISDDAETAYSRLIREVDILLQLPKKDLIERCKSYGAI